ncbi:hypothetical protein [Streptomyces altiplanensis]
MTESTHPTPLDEALARILSEPTWAQQLSTATASALEDTPFIVMDGWLLTSAINTAIAQVLAGLPGIVAAEALTRMYTVMPQARPRETAGEYALRLRAAAKGL